MVLSIKVFVAAGLCLHLGVCQYLPVWKLQELGMQKVLVFQGESITFLKC